MVEYFVPYNTYEMNFLSTYIVYVCHLQLGMLQFGQ